MEKPKECPKEVYSLLKNCFKNRVEKRLTFIVMQKELKKLIRYFLADFLTIKKAHLNMKNCNYLKKSLI